MRMAPTTTASAAVAAGIDVTAPAGKFRGITRDGVGVFRGIPYAAPPVGERRFAPPTRAQVRTDVTPAEIFGAISVQDIDPLPPAVLVLDSIGTGQ